MNSNISTTFVFRFIRFLLANFEYKHHCDFYVAILTLFTKKKNSMCEYNTKKKEGDEYVIIFASHTHTQIFDVHEENYKCLKLITC